LQACLPDAYLGSCSCYGRRGPEGFNPLSSPFDSCTTNLVSQLHSVLHDVLCLMIAHTVPRRDPAGVVSNPWSRVQPRTGSSRSRPRRTSNGSVVEETVGSARVELTLTSLPFTTRESGSAFMSQGIFASCTQGLWREVEAIPTAVIVVTVADQEDI
jgi:hypothetical protein